MTPKLRRTPSFLACGLVLLAASACQKTPPQPSNSSSAAPDASATTTTATTATTTTPTADASAASTAPATPMAHKRADPCSLLTAAEVSAIMGKTVVRAPGAGCAFGLDSSAKEKELAQAQKETSDAQRAAAGGDMNAMMRGMAQMGSKHSKLGASMMQQLEISPEATQDDQTEDSIKAIYANTGAAVRGAIAPTAPAQRGVTGIIQGIDEVPGVGDWAFSTNVASVNMGGMMSIRGRILEARKGPWHVTVSATISPDPGIATLDGQLAGVAKALIAKLP